MPVSNVVQGDPPEAATQSSPEHSSLRYRIEAEQYNAKGEALIAAICLLITAALVFFVPSLIFKVVVLALGGSFAVLMWRRSRRTLGIVRALRQQERAK